MADADPFESETTDFPLIIGWWGFYFLFFFWSQITPDPHSFSTCLFLYFLFFKKKKRRGRRHVLVSFSALL